MPNFNWKMYTCDGGDIAEYDGSQDVLQCPTSCVQAIAKADPYHGYTLLSNRDFYWYDFTAENWEGGDYAGLLFYIMSPGPKKIAFGLTISTERFWQVIAHVYADQSIPDKSGWYPWETQPPEA